MPRISLAGFARTTSPRIPISRWLFSLVLLTALVSCGGCAKVCVEANDTPTSSVNVLSHDVRTLFQAKDSKDIKNIQVLLANAGSNDPVTLKLEDIGGTNLNSMTVTPDEGGGWTKFKMNGYSMYSGTDYYIHLVGSGTSSNVEWSIADPSTYSGRTAYIDGVANTNASFIFKVVCK